MEIPVTILYSIRDDGSESIDVVTVPDEDELYDMVDAHAKEIKAAVKREVENGIHQAYRTAV